MATRTAAPTRIRHPHCVYKLAQTATSSAQLGVQNYVEERLRRGGAGPPLRIGRLAKAKSKRRLPVIKTLLHIYNDFYRVSSWAKK